MNKTEVVYEHTSSWKRQEANNYLGSTLITGVLRAEKYSMPLESVIQLKMFKRTEDLKKKKENSDVRKCSERARKEDGWLEELNECPEAGDPEGLGWGEKFWVKACIFEDSWRSSRVSPDMDSGARRSRWSQLCHLLAVLTWAKD